ncbi:hypothetical protein ACWD4G_40605 [Streptomyces sp. NPDC002643]
MVRYVHHQLVTAAEAAFALAVTVSVVHVIRDAPQLAAGVWKTGAVLVAFLTVCGVLSCSIDHEGSERRDFETALPLTEQDPALPTPRESLRRAFSVLWFCSVALPSLTVALLWEPLFAFWPLALVPDRIVKALCAARWERRHGLVLWRGQVAGRPLGEKQALYSSPRPSDGSVLAA